MKVVLDTNVYLSVFLFKGTAALAFEKCVTNHDIFISEWILAEIREKLSEKFHLTEREVQVIEREILVSANLSEPTNELPTASPDPDDNNVLRLVEFVDAEYLITGDKALIGLQKFANAHIVSPGDFLKLG